jgi:hypothetical protein
MSSFFEDLNDIVAETSAGKVLGVTLLIFLLSAAVAAGLVYLILRFIFPRIA